MGQTVSSLFGASSYSGPELPAQTPQPVPEQQKEPEAAAVREEERRRLRQRRALSGTLLTSPLGTSNRASGLLGGNLK